MSSEIYSRPAVTAEMQERLRRQWEEEKRRALEKQWRDEAVAASEKSLQLAQDSINAKIKTDLWKGKNVSVTQGYSIEKTDIKYGEKELAESDIIDFSQVLQKKSREELLGELTKVIVRNKQQLELKRAYVTKLLAMDGGDVDGKLNGEITSFISSLEDIPEEQKKMVLECKFMCNEMNIDLDDMPIDEMEEKMDSLRVEYFEWKEKAYVRDKIKDAFESEGIIFSEMDMAQSFYTIDDNRHSALQVTKISDGGMMMEVVATDEQVGDLEEKRLRETGYKFCEKYKNIVAYLSQYGIEMELKYAVEPSEHKWNCMKDKNRKNFVRKIETEYMNKMQRQKRTFD